MCAPSGRRSAPSTASETDSGRAQGQPKQASGQGEQGRLHHDFADHVPAAGAERLPHGELLDAAAGADQQQVHQVDGADQQQEQGAGLHQQQRGADRCDVVRMQRCHDRAEARRRPSSLRVGSVAAMRGVLRVDLRLRLRERRAGLEPRDHVLALPPECRFVGRAVLRSGGERGQ